VTIEPVTIDLGVMGSPSQDDDAPHLAASRRHWTAGRARLWWPAALLSAILVLTPAAAAPAGPWATSHLTVPASSRFVLADDTLYAVDPPDSTLQRTLTAYRLADGAVRWRIGWPAAAPPVVWRDLVLMIRPATSTHDGTVTALAAHTGQPRWTRTGSVVGQSGDRLVLRAGDRLHTYQADTGVRLASMPVTAAGTPRQVVGDLLLIWGRGPVIHAYDLTTLDRRWSTGVAGRRPSSIVACGQLLCLGAGDRVLAIDQDTGRPAWWTGWLPVPPGGRVEVTAGGPEWGDRILLRASLPTGARNWLVDADTGQPVTELPGWRPSARPHPLATSPRTVLLTRYLGRATWFARVGTEAPGIAVLGAIDGAPQRDCHRTERYLACYSRQAVQVWRVRLP
jgi:hypothetical protein